ncbi:MAG: PSD1 and planctomycete cytochrome C domain-containing protein, partial [Planctomycetia bacterium]|nr:PSD1 and planctomycete cytochrome C domain-containing protein [Planctomycetia bacterium]
MVRITHNAIAIAGITVAGLFALDAMPGRGSAAEPIATGNAGKNTAAQKSEGQQLFATKIQPVLATRCFKCHSSAAKKLQGGLHLDSLSGLRRGGDSGPAIAPAKVDDSLILHALRWDGLEMPPEGKLDRAVIADFERWVRMGAPWPDAAGDPSPASSPSSAYDFEKIRRTHWSLAPVKKPAIPDVDNTTAAKSDLGQTPIDSLVLAKLKQSKLTPSPPADRRTLARRAYFDLTGLPPTFDELESFAADNSPDAYERLLDRLLASQHYGERWGRHWLDVARYSDTKGQVFMRERGFAYAYTYRDYVIRAMNDDVPFDRFILEQLAADLLPTHDSSGTQDPRTLAALGFLTLRNPLVAAHLQIDDQIDTIGRGLLGLTVACARCHDHKYDAIPTEDYYSLYGVLASSEEPSELPLIGQPAATPAYAEFKAKYDKIDAERVDFENRSQRALIEHARAHVADYLAHLMATRRNATTDPPYTSLGPDDLKPGLINRWREYLTRQDRADHPVFGLWHDMMASKADPSPAEFQAILDRWRKKRPGTAPGDINPLLLGALRDGDPKSPLEVAKVYGTLLTSVYQQSQVEKKNASNKKQTSVTSSPPAGFDQLLAVLILDESPINVPQREVAHYLQRDQRDKLDAIANQLYTLAVHSPAAPPRAMTLVERPNPHDPTVLIRGNPAQPGKPVPRQFLRLLAGPSRQPFHQGSGRLEMARAIASADNPLTPRVIVNRIWMHHFGTPLVSTPDDFGARSEPPSNPALLDYLAWRLIDRGWSLKRL